MTICTTAAGAPRRAGTALAIAGMLLLGLNLRPALAAIGPLLDLIQPDTGLSSTGASLLTVLPIVAMGVFSMAGGMLRRLLGERGGITLGAALVALACLLRAAPLGGLAMLGTALLAGIGIALVQALLPATIKRRHPDQVGRMMGLYTTSIMGGASIAAASAAGLSEWLGWNGALSFWAVPAALALVLWLVSSGDVPGASGRVTASAAAPVNWWSRRRTWLLLAFFGIGTGAFTLVLAWLPPFYTQLGWDRAAAGYLMAGVTMTEVVAGLTVSAVIGRFPDRRGPVFLVLSLLIGGLLCLMLAPAALAMPACILVGLGIGSLFPLSMILAMDQSENPADAGALLSIVQGGGYLIASLMPLLAGWLRDQFADLTWAWAAMAIGVLVMMAITSRFKPLKA
ncbi:MULTISPECIES: MFS transporter [unclassified Azospirillum]|uniref:MFS transporter n=1 Tax=unclassified Azospirillum TaxID=2630922 RepID=UPI000B676E27|nr:MULTISPECIES: MFS transporter [unclassified Azospirillum]SNS47092.1 MFS transporter, CP family, cyanate transporter [Azospirillum sp. RU38E]SNS66263.1 MFS transporter, CP family, cyanate transporter [Azospirillum sp. RU37A]